MRKYYQGKYSPDNPEKYLGDPTNIVFRSRWELVVMKSFDSNPAVLKWGSEEVIIPYFWEVDSKMHRYFTDFVILVKTTSGNKKYLVEVKPYAQTIEPVQKKGKRKKTMLNETMTYSKNQAKWRAAKEWCKNNNYGFLILTEKDIFKDGKAW